MITKNWREVQSAREAERPEVLFIFVEMRRPRHGVVIFEAPEYGVSVQQHGVENFAPHLKHFIDHDVGPIVRQRHPDGPGVADIILIDPAWSVDGSPLVMKYGETCRIRAFPEEPKVRGIGYCYAHKRWCGNDGPPSEEEQWR